MDSEGGAIVRRQKNADGGQPSAGNTGASLDGSTPHFTTNGTHDQTVDYVSVAAKLAADGLRTRDELEAEQALLTQGLHDEGNAQCLRLRYPNKFARNAAYGWLYNTGSHWATEGAEEKLGLAIVETLQARIRAALDSGQADKHGLLIKYCIPSEARVQGAKGRLKDILFESLNTFDAPPHLVNCVNAVVNLRDGTSRPHEPGDRFLYCVPTEYDPKADQSAWVQSLTQAVGEDTQRYLQRVTGYSLTGYTSEEILIYLYGPPRAGKGLFTETIGAVLGQPLAKEVNFATFTAARSGDSQNFDLAPLKPCRMVFASESNAYERFNEAKVKALTGGNEIYCAFKHHTHFSYRPEFKIWLSSNQPVNADPDDDAVWGRVRVVEFKHSYLGREDKGLKQRMKSPEILRGVLAWAVAGAVEWFKFGKECLPEPEASARVKSAHRAELDNVGAWLEECCITVATLQAAAQDNAEQLRQIPLLDVDVQAATQAAQKAAQDNAEQLRQLSAKLTSNAAIYTSYKTWCERNGIQAKQQKGLTQALKRKGCQPTAKPVRVDGKLIRGFYGIEIVE